MKAGGTYSGVAYGGSFKDDAPGAPIETRNPSTGEVLARVRTATPDDCRRAVTEAYDAFTKWRLVPAPQRGEIVRRLGDGFRARKEGLARLISLVIGAGASIGEALLADEHVALIQATGSCALGERVSLAVAKRSGRAILELGGNNAVIVLADADLKLALRAVVFGTVGTAGQRCTSTRRLILQRPIAKRFLEQVVAAYRTIGIGDPLDDSTLMGPLVSRSAVDDYREGLAEMQRQGGRLVYGGKVLADREGYFVEPAIVRSNIDMPICKEEVFAPIVHVFEVDSLEEAIAVNNSVPQGLSSGLFTTNLAAAERWLSAVGSGCGIANGHAGTSGAEIGGAFGGEKATGGGRQAGSDAWKGYMRRQTCTINYGSELPLAQGVTFPVD